MRALMLLLLAVLLSAADAETSAPVSPLMPVKTDNPRDTLRSFMQAMDRHVRSLASGDGKAEAWLDDAVRCLDLSGVGAVGRLAAGREAARDLKEVIDRVLAVDYDKVPDGAAEPRWRLRGTEIVIRRIDEGERAGEHLFSQDTVARAAGFFGKVRDLPLLPGTLGGGYRAPWQDAWVPVSLRGSVFGVAYWQWLLIGCLVFVGLAIRLVVQICTFVLRQATRRTALPWDDDLVEALAGPATLLGTTGVWFASLHLLGITGPAYTVIALLIKAAFFISLGYLAYKIAGFVADQIERRVQAQRQDINQALLRLLKQTLKLLALCFCLLLGAQNMGMDVASLIAGLGIGGLAFALAAKDTLANLLGSVMIMLDRPFRIGDYIVVKGVEGTVEDIGFRSTRIRTVGNSLTSVPNSELVLANVDNLGMRDWRRVSETWGLTYQTDPAQALAFCAEVRSAILAHPEVKPDAVVVCLSGLGASQLDIRVNWHLRAETWEAEMALRQAVLVEALTIAKRLGVEFAYPTQTVHLATSASTAA